MKKIIPLILAGGKGSRFWPLSREHFPKQFLSLDGGDSLLQRTMDRAKSVAFHGIPYVIAAENQCDLIEKTLKEKVQQEYHFVGEPFGKNTAIAIYHGCRSIKKQEGDAIVVVLPSDHYIGNEDCFIEDIKVASNVASEQHGIVLLGVKPTSPEVGFGYAEVEKPEGKEHFGCFPVRKFTEKPDRRTAQRYLDHGNYYWNTGIFVFSLEEIEEAYKNHLGIVVNDYDRNISVEKIYENAESISFDKAILEKEPKLFLYESSFEWNDLGNFLGLSSLIHEDENGNICSGNTMLDHVTGSIVTVDNSFTVMVGVDNLIVAEHQGVLLICHKNRAPDIGNIVSDLSGNNRLYR